MPNQDTKAHHVGEWASLRNTSPEIAEAIFEVAHYDEKLAEQIWEEGSDEVLALAFAARQSEDGLRTTAARFTAAVCRAEPGDTAAVWLPRLRDWPLPAVDGPADGAGQSAS